MHYPSASPLQELRQRAGYGTRAKFAEELGIPLSTYKRYEASSGRECAIPLKAAWQIADKLGCTIDEVVGRFDPLTELQEVRLRDTFALLSAEGRELAVDLVSTVYSAQRRRAALEDVAIGERSFAEGFAEYIGVSQETVTEYGGEEEES